MMRVVESVAFGRQVRGAALFAAMTCATLLAGCGAEGVLVSKKCRINADGSVHVQGKVRNDGGSGSIMVKPFVILDGGERKDAGFLGAMSGEADSGETVRFADDITIPSGAVVVDCGADVLQ